MPRIALPRIASLAASPNVYTRPEPLTNQYPRPSKVAAIPTIDGFLTRWPATEPNHPAPPPRYTFPLVLYSQKPPRGLATMPATERTGDAPRTFVASPNA